MVKTAGRIGGQEPSISQRYSHASFGQFQHSEVVGRDNQKFAWLFSERFDNVFVSPNMPKEIVNLAVERRKPSRFVSRAIFPTRQQAGQ